MSSIMYKSKHKPSFSVCFKLSLFLYLFLAGEMVHNILENTDSEFMDLERGMCKLSEHCYAMLYTHTHFIQKK